MKPRQRADRRRRYRDDSDFFGMALRILRAAGRRAAEGDPAEHLHALVQLRDQVDAATVQAIRGMRRSGATWESIGAVTGTTRQAALMRWRLKIGEPE